jgi:hypothetical protein
LDKKIKRAENALETDKTEDFKDTIDETEALTNNAKFFIQPKGENEEKENRMNNQKNNRLRINQKSIDRIDPQKKGRNGND